MYLRTIKLHHFTAYFLSPHNSVGGDIVMQSFVGGWMHPSVALCLVDTIQTTVFAGSLFKLHMHIVDDERRNPIDFGSWGQRSRSTLTLCCIKPCGCDTDYSFCPITFKLHMQAMDNERRNSID